MDYSGGVGAEKAGKGRRILTTRSRRFERFLYDACTSIIAHTAGAIYMCMSSSELHTLQKAFVAAGGHWSTFIIWAKDRFTLGRSDYQRQFEPILYGWPEARATTGAARATRATSGSSIARAATTCIRR